METYSTHLTVLIMVAAHPRIFFSNNVQLPRIDGPFCSVKQQNPSPVHNDYSPKTIYKGTAVVFPQVVI